MNTARADVFDRLMQYSYDQESTAASLVQREDGKVRAVRRDLSGNAPVSCDPEPGVYLY